MDVSHAMTVSFLRDSVNGVTFNFSSGTSDVYKLALYDAIDSVDYTTALYSATNEVSGTGYTAGGATLSIATNPTIDENMVYWTFDDVTWAAATITAGSGLIYQVSSGRSVAALAFGRLYGVTAGNFVVNMPDKLLKLVSTVAG